MALGDADTAAILSDLKALGEAVDVVKGGTTVQGVFRGSQELLAMDQQLVENIPTVTIKRGAISTLAIGDAITVGGTSYTVRDLNDGDDGGLTVVVLAG